MLPELIGLLGCYVSRVLHRLQLQNHLWAAHRVGRRTGLISSKQLASVKQSVMKASRPINNYCQLNGAKQNSERERERERVHKLNGIPPKGQHVVGKSFFKEGGHPSLNSSAGHTFSYVIATFNF